MRKTPECSRGRRQEWVKCLGHCLIRFLLERQSRMNSLGLVSLNNFSGLWAIGLVSNCLLPGPGMIKVEAYCLLGSAGPIEEVWL